MLEARAQRDNLTFRPLAPGDLPGLHALFQASFGLTRPEAYERWRYFSTPLGVTPGAVAVDGDRLVASYTVWPVQFDMGGQTVKGGQSMDTMTHPDYRGRGVFLRLACACYEMLSSEAFEVLYGFPNDNIYKTRVQRLNWDHAGDVPVWRRPIVPGRVAHLRSPLPEFVRGAVKLVSRVASLKGWTVSEAALPPAKAAEIAARSADTAFGTCRILRDANWFSWRYSPESQRDYRFISASAKSGPCAYVVWRQERRTAVMAETVGPADALAAAIGALVLKAQALGLSAVETVTTDPQTVQALQRNGFWRRERHRFIVRALTSRLLPANIHDFGGWRVFGGDYDVY